MAEPNYSPRPLIAFAHYSAENDISGVSTWLERLATQLYKDGISVVVYLQHFGLKPQESWLFQSLSQTGISVDIEPRSRYLEDDICGVLRFLNHHRPHVFLPQCLIANYYAGAIAGQAGLPWALSMRSDDPVYWAIAETLLPETKGGLIVGVSDYICRLAKDKHLATQTFTVPSGTSIPPLITSFSDAPFRVAFSGRVIEEQKRISLVLAAMALACREDSRIQCWIIGEGSSFTSAQEWVKQQGLGDRIEFLGRLSSGDVQTHLAQCQALLLMSDYEGLPVAVLEAMAMGVVPVARAIPSGIPELVHDKKTGLLVDDTPEAAAAAILELANHPKLWAKCSLAAKQLVFNQYSDDSCYQRWLQVINELSKRSTITYPIPIPRKIVLPKIYPELLEGYRHKPPLHNRVFAHSKQYIRSQLRRVQQLALSKTSKINSQNSSNI